MARKTEWVVYAKQPSAGPQQVLDYLGRYTHQAAISSNHLFDIEDGRVRFRWKDYRNNKHYKTMSLSGDFSCMSYRIDSNVIFFDYGYSISCQPFNAHSAATRQPVQSNPFLAHRRGEKYVLHSYESRLVAKLRMLCIM
jgi:hypothetical protein